jgi:hypothetical protein
LIDGAVEPLNGSSRERAAAAASTAGTEMDAALPAPGH